MINHNIDRLLIRSLFLLLQGIRLKKQSKERIGSEKAVKQIEEKEYMKKKLHQKYVISFIRIYVIYLVYYKDIKKTFYCN